MTDWGATSSAGPCSPPTSATRDPSKSSRPTARTTSGSTFVFANGLRMYHSPGKGNVDVVGTPGEKLPPKPMPRLQGHRRHLRRLPLLRADTREKPFRDIELAHRTVTRLPPGQHRLRIEPAAEVGPVKEEFPGDEEANRFLDRARREPWVL